MKTKIAIAQYKSISDFKFKNVILESNDKQKYYFNSNNAKITVDDGNIIINTNDVLFEVKTSYGYSYYRVHVKNGKRILEYLGLFPGVHSIFFYKNIEDIDNVIIDTEEFKNYDITQIA